MSIATPSVVDPSATAAVTADPLSVPVAYGEILPFEVTEANRRDYAEQGFFVTPPIFETATLDYLRAAMHAIWASDIAAAEATGNELHIWMARERLFTANLHRRSTAGAAFLKHPNMLKIARAMIGPDVDVSYNQAVLKAPSHGERANGFAWHQDTGYALSGLPNSEWNPDIMLDDRRTFQGWVAVTRTTLENGTLRVLPGRHKEGVFPYERLPTTGEFDARVEPKEPYVDAILQPGQMLVFSGLLPHCSTPNRTRDEVRMIYQFCYTEPGARRSPDVFPVMRAGRRVE